MKKIFLLILIIILSLSLFNGCSPATSPAFTPPTEEEGEGEPTGDRVVLVELFNADGCAASAVINPIMEELAQQYGTDQVILLEEAGWGKYTTSEVQARFDWYVPGTKHTPFIAFNGLSETFSEGIVGGGGGGGTVTPTPTKVGNIEGYVYVPESRTKGRPIILRDSSQVPAGYIPLVGAEVKVNTSSKSTTTNNDGYFILSNLPIGLTTITIIPPAGSGYQTLTTEVVVNQNSTVSLGNNGAVTLPSESADHWEVTINKVDTENWPEVKVYVQVVDPINNSPIVGATSQNFRVEINGYQLSPVTVTQSGGSSSSSSSSALVIDRSGSMYGQPLADAKTAAKTFVGFMNDTDRAEVVSFESYVTVDQPFTSDKQALNSAINGLVSVNMTALYDGIWQGLDDTDLESNARKAVIAMTDGRENYSTCPGGCYPEGYSCTPDNSYLISHAQDLNIPVYTIGLQGADYTKEEDIVIDARESAEDIQQIAQETGGEYFYAPTSADLEHIYVQITQRVQQQYILTFNDDSGIFDGTLTVGVDYTGIYGEDSIPYQIQGQMKEWTVMVYIGGDNSLSSDAWNDLGEMEQVGSSDEVNIVVQLDDAVCDAIYRYEVTGANQGTSLPYYSNDIQEILPEMNTSDPSNMSKFVNWATSRYPANRYMFIIWNHGRGFRDDSAKGLIDDNGDFMDMWEMIQGLNGIEKHIDILGFDACLMAMMEVIYEINENYFDAPDYIVASEANEPGSGWPYDTILSDFIGNGNPMTDLSSICKMIVDRYIESYESYAGETLSAIDMKNFDSANIVTRINTFADELINSNYQDSIINARNAAEYYANDSSKGYKDLYDFAELISNDSIINDVSSANDIMNLVDSIVEYDDHTNYTSVDNSHGITIYLPHLYDNLCPTFYDFHYGMTQFAEDTNWNKFITYVGDKVSILEELILLTYDISTMSKDSSYSHRDYLQFTLDQLQEENKIKYNYNILGFTQVDKSGNVDWIHHVMIGWFPYEGAEAYRIWRKVGTGDYEMIGEIPSDSYQSFTGSTDVILAAVDPEVYLGTDVFYKVEFKINSQWGGESEEIYKNIGSLNDFLSACSLTSPDDGSIINDSNPEFYWNPPGSSGSEKEEGLISVFDLDNNNIVWQKCFQGDLDTDHVTYPDDFSAEELISGHIYQWSYNGIKYKPSYIAGSIGTLLALSIVDPYQFTYNPNTYSLRDIGPAGGYIFYDKGSYSNGWRYLEAAPVSTEWTGKEWGSYGTLIGGTETGIGTGENNTEIIVSWLDNNSDDTYGDVTEKTNRAGYLCNDLVYGGYSDWFLPSLDELHLMYTNLKVFGVGGFESDDYDYYWSSSEDSADDAWAQRFNDGYQGIGYKYASCWVRAARAF